MARTKNVGLIGKEFIVMVDSKAHIDGLKLTRTQCELVATADPHGLILSFIRCPPSHQTTPNDIFVIWLLSHRHQTTAEAAMIILESYGAIMLRSGSDWLKGLRELFLDITSKSGPMASLNPSRN